MINGRKMLLEQRTATSSPTTTSISKYSFLQCALLHAVRSANTAIAAELLVLIEIYFVAITDCLALELFVISGVSMDCVAAD